MWRSTLAAPPRSDAHCFPASNFGNDEVSLAIFLIAALAVAQTDSAPPSQSIPVDQENARRARAVLDRTIQALGGQAYLNIQDITQAGRTYSFLSRPAQQPGHTLLALLQVIPTGTASSSPNSGM